MISRASSACYSGFFVFSSEKEGRADAVPTTRNYTPDSPDLDERRGQPLRSAMARSRPGGTALMITITLLTPRGAKAKKLQWPMKGRLAL